jgi:hypothetical protein
VEVPEKDGEPHATLEISPLFAVTANHLKEKHLPISKVEPGQVLYLE